MTRPVAAIAGPAAGLLLVLLLSSCTPASDSADAPQTVPPTRSAPAASSRQPRVVLPDGFRLQLELAVTPEEVAQGLMFRPSLPEDQGMLFLFEVERVPSFWMKHTMIPLDLLFLDRAGAIVDLVENARPCAADPCPQYVPSRAVSAVLEVGAGTVARHALKVGDTLAFKRVPGFPQRPAIKN